MEANLSFHTEKNLRLFLFSGVPAKLEKSLLQKIESLHGKAVYPVRDTFTRSCTHVIAQEFSTTEKILGALAGGKWLLTTNYILDSYKEGHWLKEEGYELTDLNKVAKYHRRERMLKGYGLYEGWKILIWLDPPSYSRKFKRILAAGGAEIALKDDVSDIDFVITRKEMLDQVKTRVDIIKPLVDFSYIKNTLIFRHDPADLRKCDLRHPQEFKSSSKSVDSTPSIASKESCSSHGDKKSFKRPAAVSSYKKKKISNFLKQTSLTQFMRPSVKTPSSGDRRQSSPPQKIPVDKCASKSSHSHNTLSSASVSSASVVYDVDDDNQNQEGLESNETNQTQQTERKSFENLTLNALERTQMGYGNIQNQYGLKSNDIEIQQTEKNTSENVTPVNALRMMEEMDGNRQKQHGVKSNSVSEFQQTEKSIYKDVTQLSTLSNVSSVDINTHNVELKEFQICLRKKIDFIIDPKPNAQYLPKCKVSHFKHPKNMAGSLKRQPVKDAPTRSNPTENESVISKPLTSSGKGSGGHNLVSKQVHHQNKAVSPKSSVYTVTKMDIWKAIVQFLRTRNHLNVLCSTTTLSIPRGSENFSSVENDALNEKFDPQQVLDAPNYQYMAHKHRELTTRELHFYICCTDDDDDVNEEDLLVKGMDTLLLQLSSYLYPPPSIFGRLLKKFILETQFRMVHSRAQRIAYQLLNLHPPVSAKIRAYYLSALQHAMKPDDFGSYIPWKFVRNIIELASCTESDDESLSDQSMEEEEDFDEATRALHLLEFIVLLLTEDVRHSTYGKAVQDLLTWQIFCGSSKNFSVLTSPVKKLLHLWMSQQTTTPALNWHLSQLVSVVLEVLWKFSGQPLLPVDTLPPSLGAVQKEITINLKGLSSQDRLGLIRSLPTPWAQGVVTFMIVQEIAQCPNRISLPYIDVKNTNSDLKNKKGDSKELFLTLASCYLEVSSYRYVTSIIKKCICKIVSNSTEVNKHETVGAFSSSGTGTEEYCQTSNKQKNKATKKHMSQYLNLFEDKGLQDLSKLEESAVAKMYSCIKQDKDISRKWSEHNVSLISRIDAKFFFKTLCL